MIHPMTYAGLKADRLIVKDYLKNTSDVHIYQSILNVVEQTLKITREDILNRCRKRDIVDARKIITYMMRENTRIGYMALGRLMGQDHATTIHQYRTASELIKYDKTFEKKYNLVILAFENQAVKS
jgi:chromosomal replication initiator protein